MSLFWLNTDLIFLYTLVFIRVSGIVFALPIIGDQPVPIRVRILFALALSFAIGVNRDDSLTYAAENILSLSIVIVKELLIGLLIGFVARVAFVGVLMAASIVSYQMGFGTANLIMPDFDAQIDSFSAFHRIFVVLIFLSLDLHHVFFRAIYKTFEIIPSGKIHINPDIHLYLVKITSQIFLVAIQLSAPLLIALLFTMAALGLVSRAVPQLNVFTMSFPVSFFVGMLIYLATFLLYPTWAEQHFGMMQKQMYGMISGLKPQ